MNYQAKNLMNKKRGTYMLNKLEKIYELKKELDKKDLFHKVSSKELKKII